ncbi:MAG: beta-ketoacyl-ACP synthase III [Candidatus Hydrogenedentes bacterium]|nr:beta-ketoacyl-ACP synthase III [Candidatus Hydrogenedentota bacterium]
MIRSRIIGTGHFLPERVVTNKELEAMCDTTDEWIRQRTGIEQRHFARPGDGASDIATPAVRQAMEAADVTVDDIDLVLCTTTTPDYVFPATACVVADNIGMGTKPAFDINAACSGFMYGLATADAFIRSGMYKTIALVGSELASNRVNFGKRDTAVLFGDGAGAVILRAEEGDKGVLTTHLWADGSGREVLWLPAGGSKIPVTNQNVDDDINTIHMKGKELFRRAVIEFANAAKVALDAAGMTFDDIKLFIPHQANIRIIEAVAERMNLPADRCVVNIQKVANCTAGSIPLALSQAVDEGRVKDGDIVLLASFGAGLTWASAIVRW